MITVKLHTALAILAVGFDLVRVVADQEASQCRHTARQGQAAALGGQGRSQWPRPSLASGSDAALP